VDIQGLGDEANLRQVGEIFELHPLTLEGAVNVPQRVACEVDSGQHRIVARAPLLGEYDEIEVPQVCMILARNYLLTS
jgi:magnesium transporter